MQIKNIKNLTTNSIILGLFLAYSLSPGYLQVGPISLTTMHIFFLIGMYVLFLTYKFNLIICGTIYGFIFGFSALIRTLITPDATTVIFINPLFSILPRVMTGFVVGVIATIFDWYKNKIINSVKELNKFQKIFSYIHYIILAIFTTLLNTIFFLGFLLFLGPKIYPQYIAIFQGISWLILITNFLPELLLAILIFPPVIKALVRVIK